MHFLDYLALLMATPRSPSSHFEMNLAIPSAGLVRIRVHDPFRDAQCATTHHTTSTLRLCSVTARSIPNTSGRDTASFELGSRKQHKPAGSSRKATQSFPRQPHTGDLLCKDSKPAVIMRARRDSSYASNSTPRKGRKGDHLIYVLYW